MSGRGAPPVLSNRSGRSEVLRVTQDGGARRGRRRRKRGVGEPLEVKHGRMFTGSAVTYQLEYRFCGKKKCRKLHGPYWYAYWKASNRVQHLYIGKEWCSVDDKIRQLRERQAQARAEGA